jgi:hypothetical protein
MSILLILTTSAVFLEVNGTGSIACKVCPKVAGAYLTMRRCHVPGHEASKKHKHRVVKVKKDSVKAQGATSGSLDDTGAGVSMDTSSPLLDTSFQIMTDGPTVDRLSDNAPSPMDVLGDAEFNNVEYPLGKLWEDLMTERTYMPTDYFEEMQIKMEQGESFLTCLLRPLEDELGVETEGLSDDRDEDEEDNQDYLRDDHGIDVQGMWKSC